MTEIWTAQAQNITFRFLYSSGWTQLLIYIMIFWLLVLSPSPVSVHHLSGWNISSISVALEALTDSLGPFIRHGFITGICISNVGKARGSPGSWRLHLSWDQFKQPDSCCQTWEPQEVRWLLSAASFSRAVANLEWRPLNYVPAKEGHSCLQY